MDINEFVLSSKELAQSMAATIDRIIKARDALISAKNEEVVVDCQCQASEGLTAAEKEFWKVVEAL
jgi:hypothetical protein